MMAIFPLQVEAWALSIRPKSSKKKRKESNVNGNIPEVYLGMIREAEQLENRDPLVHSSSGPFYGNTR